MVRVKEYDITTTGDNIVIENSKETKIKLYKLVVTNNSGVDANISVIDRVTIDSTNYDVVLYSGTLSNGASKEINPENAEYVVVDGNLVINTNNQPIHVYVEYDYTVL